jgi:hypothetical protein
MSVEVGTAYLTVVPSAKGFAGKLQSELGGGMAAAGTKAGDTASKSFGTRFKSGMATAAKAGALAVAGALALGVGFAKSAIAEARESQKVGALTENVIRSTGGAAKVTAAQVGDLATAISNKTGIDDEQIQSGANMLLTFKNIRNEAGKGNDIFNQSTQILTDLATAMGTDPQKAAIQLGKALNDPVKGISALSRVGVTFTDQQKKTIDSLVKGGKTAEAQKIILGELKSEFGGAAEASSTMGEKAATSFGNLKEQIGTALLPYLDKAEKLLVEKVIPAISNFFTEMQNGTGKGGAFVNFLKEIGSGAQKVAEHGTALKVTIAAIVTGLVAWKVATAAMAVTQAISLTILKAQTVGTVQHLIVSKTVAVATKAWAAAQWLMNAALTANPIGLVVVAIATLVAGLIIAYKKSETFRNIVNDAFSVVKEGALRLASVAVGAFRMLLNFYLTMVGALVNGAAKAFGWVPGLGPKLKTAAAKFNTFKDETNAALAKVEKDLKLKADTTAAQRGIDQLRREAQKPITVEVFMKTKYTAGRVNVKGLGPQNAGNRASGGPVSAGSPYWVGENPDGSLNRTSELFVPKTSGTIYNQSQLAAMAGGKGSTYNIYTNDPLEAAYAVERRQTLRARVP